MRKFRMVALLIPALILAACGSVTQQAPTQVEIPTAALTVEPSPTPTEASPTPTEGPSPTPTPYKALITVNNAWGLNIQKSLELPIDPAAIIWSMDGSTLAVTAYKDVVVVNVADMTIVKHLTLPEDQVLLDFSTDGVSMATSKTDFKTIMITNVLTGNVTQTIEPGVQFVSVSFSPDGSQLIVGSVDQWAGLIYNIASGKLVDTVTGFQTAAPVYNVRFGPDENSLVWVARGTIQVEKIAGQSLGAYIGHEDFITAWSLNHSGDLLATSAGGTVNDVYSPLLHFWNPTTGVETAKLPLTDSAISLAFSPDDTLLAATVGDSVSVWDVGSQVQVFTNPAHIGGVRDARFSPDGGVLASIGADSVLNLWTTK